MLENGYIKLYRSFLKWEWYDDINTKVLFLHLILTVNHYDENWHGVKISRGQRICSYGKLANETKLSVQSVRTALKHLISTHEVTHEATAEYGLFTVNNYDKFQCLTDDQHTANIQPTDDQQQSKKANKAKKDTIALFGEENGSFNVFWKAYPKKVAKPQALKAFNKIKPDELQLQQLLLALEKQKSSPQWQKDSGQYIPNPATYLNQRRWEDEVGTTADSTNDSWGGIQTL